MFRYAKDGCVRWPVPVQQVQEDGSTAEQTVVVTYQRMTRADTRERDAEVMAYTEAFRALLPADGAADSGELARQRQALTDARMAADDARLRDRVKGWSGVADQDGNALPFSAELLQAFIADELLRGVLLRGLLDASAGAQTKNSLPGLAGLPAPAQA